MIKRVQTNRGLIKAAVIFILLLIIFAYLGLNIRSIVASQTFQDNWSFIKDIASIVWNDYLSVAVRFVWDNILVPIIKKI
jgi:ABC-type phosphate/phosphonate transport system permease subunit